MKKQLLFIFVFSLFNNFQEVKAQDLNEPTQDCRTPELNDLQFKRNPQSLKEFEEFNLFSKEYGKKMKSNKAAETTYTIPVVFHVYGTSFNGKTLTLEKIKNALMHLNEDFQGLNDDFNSVDPFFQDRRGTLNIEFRLAQKDPEGGCTTGVVYEVKKDGFGNATDYYDAQIKADAWDNHKYMNIYVQNDLYANRTTNNSGIAFYPNTFMSDNKLARVVYNGAFIGENTDKEFASTLTHEFGHFLNLLHTFEGGCTGTDQVDDTPIEDGNHTLRCTAGTNCNGDKVNIENYMGYNGARGCYKMYTQGQIVRLLAGLQHPSRKNLWTAQNLIDTGVATTANSIVANTTKFKENETNDGTVSGASIVTLTGTTFVKSNGVLISGTDFTTDFPEGLTADITLNSNTEATVTISGKVENHGAGNSTSGRITLLDPAIATGVSGMLCNSLNWNIKFRDPYGIYLVDITDRTVNPTTTKTAFTIEKADNPKYEVWQYAVNHLKLETYGKRLVTNIGTKSITPLDYNTVIDASSNFTAPGANPNQLDIRTPTYTTWDGKTDYIGFEYLIDGEKCYGWFKAVVDADGSGYSIVEYAYNTAPGASITTPANLGTAAFENAVKVINYPNPFTEFVNLTSDLLSGNQVDVIVYNSLGQSIYNKKCNNSANTISINTTGFASGFYILQLAVNSKIINMKMVKN